MGMLTDPYHSKGQPFKQRPVKSPVWQMWTGIWNGLTCCLWLWGVGHIKTWAPGSSFYGTRWHWRYLCQQHTALCSRCGAATHKHKSCTKAQLWLKHRGHHCACLPFFCFTTYCQDDKIGINCSRHGCNVKFV